MSYSYILTPFLAWLIAGSTKFLVNSARSRSIAISQIGYGGFPSNHTAITSSIAWLILIKEGPAQPALGVAISLTFIVILDATSLRRKVGLQAERLNSLTPKSPPLRERMGHTPIEIAGGLLTGFVTAMTVCYLPY